MKVLNPSHAKYWTRCPSFEYDSAPDTETSTALREGIAAAWLADMTLKCPETSCIDFLGEHDIDEQMCNYVQQYVDYIKEHDSYLSEHECYIPELNISGRMDTGLNVETSTLEIVDFKYGYKIVEPDQNPQLICYGMSLLQPYHTHIRLTIFQPRTYHVDGEIRSVCYSRQEFEKLTDWIRLCVSYVNEPDPMARPSDICKYCDKRSTCQALVNCTYEGFDHLRDNRFSKWLTPVDLSNEYTFLVNLEKLVSARLTAIKSETETRIKSGEFIPGFIFDEKQGRKEFSVDIKTVEAMTRVKATKTVNLTPAQLIKEGANPDIVNAISKPSSYGMKLTPYKPTRIRKLFND